MSPFAYAKVVEIKWPLITDASILRTFLHLKIYNEVRKTCLPNYIGARIPIPSDIRCDRWEELLLDYHDAEVVQFLRYGWPGGYTAAEPPHPTFTNHTSAVPHAQHVDKFVAHELEKGALAIPFTAPPFDTWTQISPLMTRPKSGSNAQRIIVDLSFPRGNSVNDGVPRNVFQGRQFTYTLPTVMDMANHVLVKGRGSYLWKADLERGS